MTTVMRVRGTAVTNEDARIAAILARAGQFCCASYAQQLLREKGRKLGTVMGRINYCVALLRKGEDLGTYVGQAIRFCLMRLPTHNPDHPMEVFTTCRTLLAHAEEKPCEVEYWLREAILTERISDPTGLLAAAERAAAVPQDSREGAPIVRIVPAKKAPSQRLTQAA